MGSVLSFPRTLALVLLLGLGTWFALSDTRLEWYGALLPFFEWMETTVFGTIGKTWGGAFAVVQAAHLLSMAVLGGAVLVGDGRLLGLFMKEVPAAAVLEPCHRLFLWSLAVVVFTGVFMACGVAVKVYYLEVFWFKMLSLGVGVLFALAIRRPLLQPDPDAVSRTVRSMVAIASIMIWFTVAATGRWIGFSG